MRLVCVFVSKKFLNIFFSSVFRFCMLRVFINFLSFRFGISLLEMKKSFTLCSHSSRCLEELNLNRCIVRCWKTIKIFYNKRSLQISILSRLAQFSLRSCFVQCSHTWANYEGVFKARILFKDEFFFHRHY